MKLLIASDIHGSAYHCRRLMDRVEAEKPDQILLLGDLLYHGPRNDLPQEYCPKAVIPMLSRLAPKILAVRGNCEAEVDQMVLPFPCMADYALVEPEPGMRLYATHGHLWNPEKLPPLTRGTVFLYGHTHKKDWSEQDGIPTLNPGSVSIPKDGSHSYMTCENRTFTWKDLDGAVLHQICLPRAASGESGCAAMEERKLL